MWFVLAEVQSSRLHPTVLSVLGGCHLDAQDAIAVLGPPLMQTLLHILRRHRVLLEQAPPVGVLEEHPIAILLATLQVDLVDPPVVAALHPRIPREGVLPVPRGPVHGMDEGQLVAQLLRGHYVRRHLVEGCGLLFT